MSKMNKLTKSEYWRQRQNRRLAYSERLSNQVIANIAEVYDDSLKHVQKRIDNILINYSKDIGVNKDTLKQLLNDHDRDKLLSGLEDRLHNLGDSKENLTWLRGNYLHRLTEQEAIQLELETERRLISELEEKSSNQGYSKTMEEAYETLTSDLTGAPKKLGKTAKDMILNNKWIADGNYSNRIWNNTDKLFKDVNRIIKSGLLSGRSRVDMQRELSERYGVALHRAETLVRTEMNYFENSAELLSYIDSGVTEYEYFATRDKRTSETCVLLDKKIFKVTDAVVGENYPPLHPNCRSGTLPVIDSMD